MLYYDIAGGQSHPLLNVKEGKYDRMALLVLCAEPVQAFVLFQLLSYKTSEDNCYWPLETIMFINCGTSSFSGSL